MTLKDYLKKTNLTMYKFAKLSGFSYPFVYYLCVHKRRSNPRNAYKIQKLTHGMVKAKDILKQKAHRDI